MINIRPMPNNTLQTKMNSCTWLECDACNAKNYILMKKILQMVHV